MLALRVRLWARRWGRPLGALLALMVLALWVEAWARTARDRFLMHLGSSDLLRPVVPDLSWWNAEQAAELRLAAPPYSPCNKVMRFGGVQDGGWFVCGDRVRQGDCVIFSVGSNNDFSFEDAATALNCTIHVFDHTSIFEERWRDDAGRSIRLHPWGLAAEGQGRVIAGPRELVSLSEMCRRLQVQRIDVLKVDIEYAEWELFASLVAAHSSGVLPVGQLMVELHLSASRDDGYDKQREETAVNLRMWRKFVDHFGLQIWVVEENKAAAWFLPAPRLRNGQEVGGANTILRCCTNVHLLNPRK